MQFYGKVNVLLLLCKDCGFYGKKEMQIATKAQRLKETIGKKNQIFCLPSRLCAFVAKVTLISSPRTYYINT